MDIDLNKLEPAVRYIVTATETRRVWSWVVGGTKEEALETFVKGEVPRYHVKSKGVRDVVVTPEVD